MITVGKIKGGETYLGKHLVQNDYYAGEGEEQAQGQWHGKLAHRLGLDGVVEEADFEALRTNQKPGTSEKLTPRNHEISFYDIQFSAPKDVSVLAMVGDDPRVVEAFNESVNVAFQELEHFAATRVRKGGFAWTEEKRQTSEICSAVFHHDSSRLLDPQLHAHAVTANATWDKVEGKFKALHAREMMEASKYVREVLYSELSSRLERMGYKTAEHTTSGFSVVGVEHLRERFSQRALDRKEFEKRYTETFSKNPSKARIEHFIKDGKEEAALRFATEYKGHFKKAPAAEIVNEFVQGWREKKLKEITTPEVRKLQHAKLSEDEQKSLKKIVRSVNENRKDQTRVHDKSPVRAIDALEMGFRDVFERKSVAAVHEVLEAAMASNRGAIDPQALRLALNSHPDVVKHQGEMTLRSVIAEERTILNFSGASQGKKEKLADASMLKQETNKQTGLSKDQFKAAQILADSENGISVLIGDAGTGKTFLLEKLRAAATDPDWIALAPTGRARDELKKNEFEDASTLQKFLVTGDLEPIRSKTVVLDEAGMVSVPDMAKLCRMAFAADARLILVGDTKQHSSVERGDALRAVLESNTANVAQLSEVRRQKSRAHAKISAAIAAGNPAEALDRAQKAKMIREIPDETKLFKTAAKEYVDSVAKGEEILVVCPTWKEIERFSDEARIELKKQNLISNEDVSKDCVKSLSWTSEKKTQAWHYEKDQILTFHKKVKGVSAGESLTVQSVNLESGKINTLNSEGHEVTITKKQSSAFDVCKKQPLQFSEEERILFRANCHEAKMNNGETATIKNFNKNGSILLDNGNTIPKDFAQLSHGHAVTSHKSQGASVKHSISLVGSHSMRAANLQQFYVSNTRYQIDNKIFTSNLEELKIKVGRNSKRMLGTELEQKLNSANQRLERKGLGIAGKFLASIRNKITRFKGLTTKVTNLLQRNSIAYSRKKSIVIQQQIKPEREI